MVNVGDADMESAVHLKATARDADKRTVSVDGSPTMAWLVRELKRWNWER
jgi:hypothetical protein